MTTIGLLLRARLRCRRRSWFVLGWLVSLVSGLVLAAADAGRRTTDAFPAFEAAHGYDAFFYGVGPLPGVAALPEVSLVTALTMPTRGQPTCACARPINANNLMVASAARPIAPCQARHRQDARSH